VDKRGLEAGRINAIAYNDLGTEVASHEKHTVGTASKIVLTPISVRRYLPRRRQRRGHDRFRGHGRERRTVPDEGVRVDFTASGQGVVPGRATTADGGGARNKDNLTSGYFLFTERGINRVFVRATRTAGSSP